MKEFIEVVAFVVLVLWLTNHISFSRDTTDSPTERSGLALYTDHATGVQYVGTLTGLTVRVGKDGKPYSDK